MPSMNPSRLFAFLVEFGNGVANDGVRPGGDLIAFAAEKAEAASKWKSIEDDSFIGGALFSKLETFQRAPLMEVIDFLIESEEMGRVGTIALAIDPNGRHLYEAVYAYQRFADGELVTLPRPDCPVDAIEPMTEPVHGFAYETFSTGESRIIALTLDEESGELRPCDESAAFVGVARTTGRRQYDLREVATKMARDWWREKLISKEDEPVSVAGRVMTRSLADFERACSVLIKEENRKIAPDTALIGVLCDAVRLSREHADRATGAR